MRALAHACCDSTATFLRACLLPACLINRRHSLASPCRYAFLPCYLPLPGGFWMPFLTARACLCRNMPSQHAPLCHTCLSMPGSLLPPHCAAAIASCSSLLIHSLLPLFSLICSSVSFSTCLLSAIPSILVLEEDTWFVGYLKMEIRRTYRAPAPSANGCHLLCVPLPRAAHSSLSLG